MKKILDKLKWFSLERFAIINLELNCANGFVFELLTISFLNFGVDRSLFLFSFAERYLYLDVLFLSVLRFEKLINPNIQVKCIKSLYRSVYKGNAFTKNKKYYIIKEDLDFYYIKDNTGRDFDIKKIKEENNEYYLFDDYFKIIG